MPPQLVRVVAYYASLEISAGVCDLVCVCCACVCIGVCACGCVHVCIGIDTCGFVYAYACAILSEKSCVFVETEMDIVV